MQFFDWNSEPIQLRVLKQQLANLTCKCLNCKKYNKQCKKNIQNAGVQFNQSHGSVDRFSQATAEQKVEKPIEFDKASSNLSTNTGNKICPSCRIIVEFLRGNLNKVLKDEETETYPVTCCDKSTDQTVEYLEKSTSTIKKCKSCCEMLKTISNEFDDCKSSKKRNNERVSFDVSEKVISEFSVEKETISETEKIFDEGFIQSKSGYGSCICLEKFINALRPPIF